MADPTVRLDEEGEVMRMVNREGYPEILKIMEAKDSKGNLTQTLTIMQTLQKKK